MIASTLVNGLWQGAALTAAAYLITVTIARCNASTRYAIWFATLIALAVIPVLTSFGFGSALAGGAGGHASAISRISLIPTASVVERADVWFARLWPWALVLWLGGATISLMRLAASFVRIEALRRDAIRRADLGSNIFVSDVVTVPIVAGFLSPIIVLPTTLETYLSHDDLQRIVRHERAHIRRRDPLFNLIARAIQALLFFNPWVRIAGRQLCMDREIACDDWVVEETGNPTGYAACLATLAQTIRRQRPPLLTPSAFRSRASLVARIKRLGSDRPRRLIIDAYAVGGAIMVFAVLTIALGLISPALALTPITESSAQPAPVLVAASCAVPNIDAVVTKPAEPILPHGLKVSGKANVAVTIAPNGHVIRTSIVTSSGNAAIDSAVVKAALESGYAPKLVNCVPVQGQYLFQVEFKPLPG